MKRCVITVLAFGVFFVFIQTSAMADQPPATNSFAGQILADGKIGRVGVGTTVPAATLDVYQGEIKIGSTGTPCSKDLNGALRSQNSRLQFCDGASWRNVSLDKGQ